VDRAGLLSHYATIRKVACSILDVVIEFFPIYLILPDPIIALGFTQPLTEMSTRNHLGREGKVRPAGKFDDHTAICESIVLTMGNPRRLTTL
jgi:hypothetical protein